MCLLGQTFLSKRVVYQIVLRTQIFLIVAFTLGFWVV
jgi:hypothetical protein